MELVVIYLLMVQKLLNLEQKILKLQQLCIGNISKDFSYSNIKRTGLYGYVYDLGGDFDAIAVDDILTFTSI